ncbi:hypothetical protein GW17_00000621 [Ensete ventricosum]|nr:hypothetical protein GW17_00000621 [Ensete ventricosum]
MPTQGRALVKDVDLEPMSMNLKEGDRYVVNRDEDLTAVDFDGDVSLAEKEQSILLEPSSIIRLDQIIMPPQDQVPVNDQILNRCQVDRCVINRGEGLMMVDFDGDVSLVEMLVQYGAGIVELVEQKLLRHEIGTTKEIMQKLSLNKCCRRVEPGGLCRISGNAEKKRGWWGGASGVARGQRRWQRRLSSSKRALLGELLGIAGVGGYINERKNQLAEDHIRRQKAEEEAEKPIVVEEGVSTAEQWQQIEGVTARWNLCDIGGARRQQSRAEGHSDRGMRKPTGTDRRRGSRQRRNVVTDKR